MTEQAQQPEVKEPNTRLSLSADDDSLIVWFFYCCQYSDKSILTQSLKITLAQAYDRFIEIQNSKELMQRCLDHMKNDILGYKPPPFSRGDLYYYSKIKKSLNILDQNQIMEKFPLLFHPAITPAEMHKKTITARDSSNLSIDSYIQEINESVAGHELVPFPGDFEDPIDVVRKQMNQNTETDQIDVQLHVNQLIDDAFKDVPSNTYAILIGQFCNFIVDKSISKIGRNSPRIKVDINIEDPEKNDVSKISRHHCTLQLAKDLQFYMRIFGSYILVNGELICCGQTVLLKHKDILDIGGQPLIFLENVELFKKLRSMSSTPKHE